MSNNFFLYGLSLPGLATCLLYKCPMLWCQVSLYKEWSFAWCHHASPSWFCNRGGKETQVAKLSNRECGCVLPRSCPSQKTEGRTSSTFPLKPPAPGPLLVLGEWTYFSEVQKRKNTFFYLVSYFSPCMFLWHSKAIWQACVRNIWNYLNFYECFSFCIDLVKKVIKVMLYK